MNATELMFCIDRQFIQSSVPFAKCNNRGCRNMARGNHCSTCLANMLKARIGFEAGDHYLEVAKTRAALIFHAQNHDLKTKEAAK